MSIKVPKVGLNWALLNLKNAWGPLTLRLFMNDKVPGDDDTLAGYAEPIFSGYAPVPIAQWADPVLAADGLHYQVQGTAITFTHSGGPDTSNIYGYMVTFPTTGLNNPPELAWAERFSTPPIAMAALGDFITIVPVFQDRSEF